MYEVALSILKQLEEQGEEAYIIGGYPRDLYMGKVSDDIDICTSASYEVISSLFVVNQSHCAYGSYVIEKDKYEFEITTYRKDLYLENRYPTVTFVSTLKEDLERRDFIINTLCLDSNGEYVDLLGAREDIDKRIIRTVKDADQSFNEDPLRIIRAVRLMTVGYNLSEDVLNAVQKNKALLQTLSNNRIQKEIDKVIDKENLSNLFESLDLKQYLP